MNDDFLNLNFDDNSPPPPDETGTSGGLFDFISASGTNNSGAAAAPASTDATNSFLDAFGHVFTTAIQTAGAVEIAKTRAPTTASIAPTATRAPVATTTIGGAPWLLPAAGLALLYFATR